MNDSLPNYTVHTRLHRGRSCEVFRASRFDGKPVILKRLRSDKDSEGERAWLHREFELASATASSAIAKPLDFVQTTKGCALVFEDIGAVSLDRLVQQRPLDLEDRLRLAVSAAQAVAQLHGSNLIHLDIHPGNVIVHPQSFELKLIDLGSACDLPRWEESSQSSRPRLGSLHYIAPEQTGRINRAVDQRADFYALGVLLYELFVGRHPFSTDDPVELVHSHIAVMPEPPQAVLSSVPPALSDVLMHLLAKTPEERYQSNYGILWDLKRVLQALLDGESSPSFAIGKADISERFHEPQKIYGRDHERQVLEARVRALSLDDATPSIVWVSGGAGVGKSSIARECQPLITGQGGYFFSGKFDQLKRSSPYSAFATAFSQFARHILGEKEDALTSWREKLMAALGNNGAIITELVPEFERILGPQPEVVDIGPTEAQNRFETVVQNFVRALATSSKGLVLFLDDVQWADLASLKLLEVLLSDVGLGRLMLVVAYRDQEVDADHPVAALRSKLQEQKRLGCELALEPLDGRAIDELVGDILGQPEQKLASLTEFVAQRSQGNPFFASEILRKFFADGLLEPDRMNGCWQWNIEHLRASSLADNVVGLLLETLRRLPPATQQILKTAACIGSHVDLGILVATLEGGRSVASVYNDVEPALSSGLLWSAGGYTLEKTSRNEATLIPQEFQFPHDRVQQAAYRLIEDSEKASIHERIGWRLRATLSEDPETIDTEPLLLAVDQLNRGVPEQDNEPSLLERVRLNLEAAQRAKAALAYDAGCGYLEVASRVAPVTGWQCDFGLMFALYREWAYLSYLSGQLERSRTLCETLLERTQTDLERAQVYLIMVSLCQVQAQSAEGLEFTQKGLALVDGVLPLSEPPERIEQITAQAFEEIDELIGDRNIASLAEVEAMHDPQARIRTALLVTSIPPVFFLRVDLYPLVVCTAVRTMLKYGPSPDAADVFCNFGHLVSGVHGAHERGYEFGELAMSLSRRFNRQDMLCRSAHNLANFIGIWSRPLQNTVQLIDEGAQAGIEGGERTYRSYITIFRPYAEYYMGRPLDEVRTQMAAPLAFARDIKNSVSTDIMRVLGAMLEGLQNESLATTELSFEGLNESALLEDFDRAGSGMATAFLYLCKAEFLFLSEKFSDAYAAACRAEELRPQILNHFSTFCVPLYKALSAAALHCSASGEQRDSYYSDVSQAHVQFGAWVSTNPGYFEHLHHLLGAERARLDGDLKEATRLYELAIDSAQAGGYIQHQALAAELAGRAWIDAGSSRFGGVYLGEALGCYEQRRAVRKVRLLESRYPKLRPPERDADREQSSAVAVTDAYRPELVDGASVLRSSQAISEEIVLDRLLERLLPLLLECAGARQGALIMARSDRLEVAVEAKVKEDAAQAVRFLVKTPETCDISEHHAACESVVRYVARTHEAVLLDNASEAPQFASDEYIRSSGTKSLLCMPILRQGRLLAIVYLENDLLEGAFDAGRTNVLRALSGQIAISLEHALLYQGIENRVQERTSELNRRNQELQTALFTLEEAQQQLVQSEKMASMGRLSLGVAHEIRNPLNFVMNYASLSAGLLDEITEQWANEPDVGQQALEPLMSSLVANSKKITKHCQRMEAIVSGMVQHAGGASLTKSTVEVNDLVEKIVTAAQQDVSTEGGRARTQFAVALDPSAGAIVAAAYNLRQALENVLRNAQAAVLECAQNSGAEYTPRISVQTVGGSESVTIVIEDNGLGIPEGAKAKIFEPLFTTKPAGQGTGLGLSLAYDAIVEVHGGTIDAKTPESGGARFEICVPRRQPAKAGRGGVLKHASA